MFRLSLLVIFLSQRTGADLECPQGWVVYEESCYGFGDLQLNWADADAFCKAYGSNLAEIETGGENAFLKTVVQNKHVDTRVWLGATDAFEEGVWTWVTSGKPLHPFSDWGPSEPNDEFGEDCLCIQKQVWNDAPCTDLGYILCETTAKEGPIVG